MRAIENGAVVIFGHMRLSGGFRCLYPVLETWLEGRTVGEGYQRLMNANLAMAKESPADVLALPEEESGPGRNGVTPGNTLLYVVIGDPALQPFEKLTE
jgi:hypothetical protein